MRMCVRGGGLCSCCVMLRVLYSPLNAHVCSRWWVVFSSVVLCCVSCIVPSMCLGWWVVFLPVVCCAACLVFKGFVYETREPSTIRCYANPKLRNENG
jgi:hypothetical protein